VLTEPARVRSGQRLRTRLAQGLVISTVESTGSTDHDERMYDTGTTLGREDERRRQRGRRGATRGDDIEGLSYERRSPELDQIIERLERGAVPSTRPSPPYERGAGWPSTAGACSTAPSRGHPAGGRRRRRITEKPLEPEREARGAPIVPPRAPLTPAPHRGDALTSTLSEYRSDDSHRAASRSRPGGTRPRPPVASAPRPWWPPAWSRSTGSRPSAAQRVGGRELRMVGGEPVGEPRRGKAGGRPRRLRVDCGDRVCLDARSLDRGSPMCSSRGERRGSTRRRRSRPAPHPSGR